MNTIDSYLAAVRLAIGHGDATAAYIYGRFLGRIGLRLAELGKAA